MAIKKGCHMVVAFPAASGQGPPPMGGDVGVLEDGIIFATASACEFVQALPGPWHECLNGMTPKATPGRLNDLLQKKRMSLAQPEA